MIGESSSISTVINNDTIVKGNPLQSGKRQDTAKEDMEQKSADVASFSPQALALDKNVSQPGASAEQGQSEPQGRGQGGAQSIPARFLDIRV